MTSATIIQRPEYQLTLRAREILGIHHMTRSAARAPSGARTIATARTTAGARIVVPPYGHHGECGSFSLSDNGSHAADSAACEHPLVIWAETQAFPRLLPLGALATPYGMETGRALWREFWRMVPQVLPGFEPQSRWLRATGHLMLRPARLG